eukprot:scaffold12068_cov104-Isochrysis_galbana.AAC.1
MGVPPHVPPLPICRGHYHLLHAGVRLPQVSPPPHDTPSIPLVEQAPTARASHRCPTSQPPPPSQSPAAACTSAEPPLQPCPYETSPPPAPSLAGAGIPTRRAPL